MSYRYDDRSPERLHMRRGIFILSLFCALFLCAHSVLTAQLKEHIFDSEGKLFWVTFIQGWGGGGAEETPDMRLYLSAVEPTTVTITDNRSGATTTVSIPVANRSVEVDVTTLFGVDFELAVENLGISRKSLRIEADVDLTVYGVTTRLWSSDGFLALPDDVLTRRYIVLAYPNGMNRQVQPWQQPDFDHPSEFAVVATEDNTLVTIHPTANINGRPTLDPIVVGLNRGEVFFAQASLDTLQDVTGTQVRSTKPIAVFAGNRRTSIPTDVGNFRDLLVEQMPPLDAWGTSVILTPVFSANDFSLGFDPVARIVAAADNTTWTRDGVPQPPLMGGVPIEIILDESPTVIEASSPILVAQYEHSNQESIANDFGLGDPFMMIVPPYNQFDTNYSFQSVPHDLFSLHFVNVVIPTTDIASLRIDDQPVSAPFLPVPGTPFSYAQVELGAGAHYAYADAPFGLYAYGFGEANSYGYPGGMLLEGIVVDFQPPYVNMLRRCDLLDGALIDDRITDWGIDSAMIVPKGTKNVDATIETFEPGDDSVHFQAKLRDPYQDGDLLIRAVDSGGRSTLHQTVIPGFTVGASVLGGNAPVQNRVASYNGASLCTEVLLVNYGRFPQSVSDVLMSIGSSPFRLETPGSFTLEPGEERIVEVCFDGMPSDSLFELTVSVGDSCISRDVLAWQIVSIVDTAGPTSFGSAGPCDAGRVSVTFSEPDGEFYGIASIDVLDTVNARPVIRPSAGSLPSPGVDLELEQVDPYRDMIYHVRLTDMAGNISEFRDTVGGFTLAAYDEQSGLQATIRLDREWGADSLDYLGRRCDSVMLVNYGARTMSLENVILSSNREYSIPAAQFPMTIGPGDTTLLALCLEGRFAGEQIDTLLLLDRCGRIDRVALRTPVDFGLASGVDQCGQSLSVQAFAAARQTFLQTPFPNPSHGERLGIDIGLTRDEEVTIEVLDATGIVRLRIAERTAIPEGVHRLSFDPTVLQSGTYYCRLTTGGGEVLTSRFIIQQ